MAPTEGKSFNAAIVLHYRSAAHAACDPPSLPRFSPGFP